MASSDTQHLADLPAEISARLQEGQVQEAKKLAVEIVLCPEALRQWLPELERLFRKDRRLDSLVEILWENKDTALTDMFVVGHFMRFCGSTSADCGAGGRSASIRSWCG